ncbi:3-isopropylmalate dehydratase large subunit, partial [bacterium]|nr:3-isopropylmalate dehydratase large subunit [bacterium]
MGQTLSEKILSEHAGHDVKAGDFALVKVDWAYVQDGTGPLAVRQLDEMGVDALFDPSRCIVFLDHASPSPRQELSNDHKFLRAFCDRTGAILSDIGSGISHTVMAEKYLNPGDVAVGADSHT